MDCQQVIELYEQLFSRISRLKALKDGTIFITDENCCIKIASQKRILSIETAKIEDRNGEVVVSFTDCDRFKHVLNAENLYNYGERLCYAALDRKVFLDPGNTEKATLSGFYKMLCRKRFKKHMQIFELTIPVM